MFSSISTNMSTISTGKAGEKRPRAPPLALLAETVEILLEMATKYVYLGVHFSHVQSN